MNARVLENNENANYQHDVAENLSNGVLQRAVESAVSKESIKKKTLRPRRNPENGDQKRDQQKNLKQAQLDRRKRRGPRHWNPCRVNRSDTEEDDRRQT